MYFKKRPHDSEVQEEGQEVSRDQETDQEACQPPTKMPTAPPTGECAAVTLCAQSYVACRSFCACADTRRARPSLLTRVCPPRRAWSPARLPGTAPSGKSAFPPQRAAVNKPPTHARRCARCEETLLGYDGQNYSRDHVVGNMLEQYRHVNSSVSRVRHSLSIHLNCGGDLSPSPFSLASLVACREAGKENGLWYTRSRAARVA
jgi:hypothetical protein